MASIRLICPDCRAIYEVDAGEIPQAGRDIQCYNCDHVWFEDPANPSAQSKTDAERWIETPDPDPTVETSSGPVAPASMAPDAPSAGDVASVRADAATAPGQAGSGRWLSKDDVPDQSGDGPTEDAEHGDDPAIHDEIPFDFATMPPVPPDGARRDDRGTDVDTPSDESIPVALPARRALDSSIAEILREEAAREEAARRADREGAGPSPDRPKVAEAETESITPTGPSRPRAAQDGPSTRSQDDAFPDIERIKSSLDRPRRPVDIDDHTSERAGSVIGFATVVTLILLGGLAYGFALEIVRAIPAVADPLADYVEAVDTGRLWLDARVRALIETFAAG